VKTLAEQTEEEKERHESLMQELRLKIEHNYRGEKAAAQVCGTCKWFNREGDLCKKFGNIETDPNTMTCDDWKHYRLWEDYGEPPNFRTTDQDCCINCANNIAVSEYSYECDVLKCEPETYNLFICDRYERDSKLNKQKDQ